MSRPKSPALLRALALVAEGATVYAAAKATGLAQSTISRTIKPPVRDKCPTCGKSLRKTKNPASV